MTSKEQIVAALKMVVAVGDAIRDLGSVPSGHLYAQLMRYLSLDSYTSIIRQLKNAGLIEEDGRHLLTWVGPYKAKYPLQSTANLL